MTFSKVTAIIQMDKIEQVEEQLKAINVPGISISKVKGYGEYANFYTPDWTSTYARLEVFTSKYRVDVIAKTIIDAAHTGLATDGIVVVSPVEKILKIKTKKEMSAEDL